MISNSASLRLKLNRPDSAEHKINTTRTIRMMVSGSTCFLLSVSVTNFFYVRVVSRFDSDSSNAICVDISFYAVICIDELDIWLCESKPVGILRD